MLFLVCMNARPDVDKKTKKTATALAEETVLRYGIQPLFDVLVDLFDVLVELFH